MHCRACRKPEFAVVVVLDDVAVLRLCPIYKCGAGRNGHHRARGVLVRRRNVRYVRLTAFEQADVHSSFRYVYRKKPCAVQGVSRRNFAVAGVFDRVQLIAAEKLYDYAVQVLGARAYYYIARVYVYPAGAVQICGDGAFKFLIAVTGDTL